MSTSSSLYEDRRAARRDRACMASGLFAGAAMGVLGGALAHPNAAVLGLVGAVAGVVVGKLVATRISADEWDPTETRRPYVGVNSPDDDIVD